MYPIPHATVNVMKLYILINLSAGVPLKRRGFRLLVSIPPAIAFIVAIHLLYRNKQVDESLEQTQFFSKHNDWEVMF